MQTSLITPIEADTGCSFNKTVVHSFGNLLVFVFYSQVNEQSKQFLQNINNSIPIFGQYENVKYYSLSVQKCQESVKKFQIQTLPSVVFTQNDRKVIDKYQGDDVGTVFDLVGKLAAAHKDKFQADRIIWYPKVKSIIESCPFLVFIKGTPQNPKCGFTRSLLEILKNHKIEYTYYDIIADAEMGNWTRHYSKWLTFPQVYINGKLIGGLDSTKDLIGKGQFEKMIPGSCIQNSVQQRYKKLIEEHETIVFIDGFAFENKVSEKAVEEGRNRYGDGISVYNMGIEQKMKKYIVENVKAQAPFTVHNKQVVKN